MSDTSDNEPDAVTVPATQPAGLTREEWLARAAVLGDCTELGAAVTALARLHDPADVKPLAAAYARLCAAASARPTLRTARVLAAVRAHVLAALRADAAFLAAAAAYAADAPRLATDAQRVRAGPFVALVHTVRCENDKSEDDNKAALSALVALVVDPAATTAVPRAAVVQWAPVLARLAPAAFAATVLPPLQRAARRQPARAVALVRALLAPVHALDAGAVGAAAALVSDVVRGAEAVCVCAPALVRALLRAAAPSARAAAAAALLARLWRVAAGADGAISYVYQRTALVDAVAAVANTLVPDEDGNDDDGEDGTAEGEEGAEVEVFFIRCMSCNGCGDDKNKNKKDKKEEKENNNNNSKLEEQQQQREVWW